MQFKLQFVVFRAFAVSFLGFLVFKLPLTYIHRLPRQSAIPAGQIQPITMLAIKDEDENGASGSKMKEKNPKII